MLPHAKIPIELVEKSGLDVRTAWAADTEYQGVVESERSFADTKTYSTLDGR